MYLNKALIFGNLTRDPEKRALPSGAAVVSFAVATNRTWKDKNGVKQEDVQYHNIVAFGVQADLIAQYLRKGSSIFVEGRMQTRSWDAPDGVKKYRTEVIVDNFQFGPKHDSSTSFGASGQGGGYEPSGGTSQTGSASASKAPAGQQPPELETIQYPEEEINPDDIPF
ncbi:MAG: single-stranded DNA-binding protein [Candidatus Vogelbacteria bacterium]|nr:single-stranded DNA-binding protein [Candidatus Vogelbacteria bacterium]